MIMSPILITVLLLLPLLFLLAERSRRRLFQQKTTLPPSPRMLPFIGNLHQLGTLPHRSLFHLSEKYGPLMFLKLGSIPTIVVSSPIIAQEFMRTYDHVFASRPSLKVTRVILYNNIDVAFSPYGECWRQMKKVCMIHLLNPKIVQSYSFVRTEEVALLLKKISDHKGSDICITDLLSELANNVLCRIVLGSSMKDEKRSLVCNLVEQNSIFLSKFFVEDLFPKLKWLDRILGLEHKLMTHFKIWDTLFEDLIEEHLINIHEDQSQCIDFIDVLLRLQKDHSMDFDLTKEHIKAILMDMFSAGTDTSYTTLNWTLVELIRSPKAMKKVQDEVREIANGDVMVKEEHMHKLIYLKAVIKEVLRLHPPSPLLLPREATQDCQIKGFQIPKQTRVIINAWALGRDKAYWEDPEKFMPERFLGNELDFKGRDFHFIPFGSGRRICPGMSFAMAIVELTLANLLHRFDWKLPSGNSIEDMDMEESQGLVAMRKQKLEVVPTLYKKSS